MLQTKLFRDSLFQVLPQHLTQNLFEKGPLQLSNGLFVKCGNCIMADPGAVMTSYNLLNGTHTAAHRGLIEDMLRCEYGFDGIVMTDWIIGSVMGGDVVMPGSKGDYESLRKGLKDGKVSRKQLEVNASRMFRMVNKRK